MSARDTILAKLKASPPAETPAAPDVAGWYAAHRPVLSAIESLQQFRRCIEAAHAEVHLVGDDWPEQLRAVLHARQITQLLLAPATPHGQPIVRPHCSPSLDWEGELAVIIGREGRHIPAAQAHEYIAGYSVYNDASIREWQFHAKAIAAGKNFESTGAFGPWMVTADEIAPDRPLALTTRLNGEQMQRTTTADMIFSVARQIEYASTIFTLVPGDVIVTGTPGGVGWSRKPPQFMVPGDVVEVEIEGIGVLRNPVVQAD